MSTVEVEHSESWRLTIIRSEGKPDTAWPERHQVIGYKTVFIKPEKIQFTVHNDEAHPRVIVIWGQRVNAPGNNRPLPPGHHIDASRHGWHNLPPWAQSLIEAAIELHVVGGGQPSSPRST